MSEEQKKETVAVGVAKESESADSKKAKKNKKINVMTLKEIQDAIDKTNKNQGGLFSKYAHELIKRRDFLSKTNK